MKKKLVSLFLVLALCLACVPVTALANDDHDNHDGWTALTVNNINAGLSPGNYYLSEDVTYTGSNSIMITTGTVTLCLNGHVLNLGGKNITIDNGGALTLCDCTFDTTWGYLDSDGLWHAGSSTDSTGPQCNLTGGVITGGRGYGAGTFTYGGGVFVRNGTFTMEGGNIAGNTSAEGNGGGVYVSNVNNENNFTMNGGTITGNRAKNHGGGVVIDGTFTMEGGSITGNRAIYGGGVSLRYAGFTMNDGSIADNTATWGGVFVRGTFTMEGGSITGNHATYGGVWGDSGSRVTISGSPVIQNNTKTDGAPCNVYLLESEHITIGGALKNAQKIGVTMERPGSFTSGWVTYMQGQNPAKYFTVDDSAYGIGLDADREGVLGQKCTVTLETNGGALPDGDSPFASVVGAALPTPTKTGYTFTGWYTTSDCSGDPVNEIPAPSSGSADIKLYAGWRANTYTVTFNANGGNGTMVPQSFTYDTPQTLTANGFSCLGKTFAGWNTKADGTGTTYTDRQQISSLTADLTLYAQWTANSYQVTLNTNGGTIADGKGVTSYTYGVGVTLPTEITRSNYSFQGWYEDAGFTGEPVTEITGTDTGDKTYYAKWQYDPPYIPPTKTPSQQALDKIESAKDGDTVEITLSTGNTKLDKEVFEELAGQDITLVVKLSGGVGWTVNGRDIPQNANLTDIDMGVSMNTSSIPVDLINMVTGEMGTVQMTLAHDGEFGFTMTLTAPLGVENKGLWANLYHYNTTQKQMLFETAAQVDASGNVALKLSHASEYAIVLDEKSHELPFTDTTKGTWYQGAVEYVYRNGIMTGTSATTFEPGITLSRAMVAQILYNLEGQPDISEENLGYPYGDVDAEAWYGDAVYWARINGVATGYEDNTFRPDKAVTREELAQMLYNYAKYKEIILPAVGDLSKFPDGDEVSSWAKTAMSWATGLQVINGYEDNTLRPSGNTTRAEAASMILGMATTLMK